MIREDDREELSGSIKARNPDDAGAQYFRLPVSLLGLKGPNGESGPSSRGGFRSWWQKLGGAAGIRA
jgi:hypothetical protein